MRIVMLYPFDLYKPESPGVDRIIAHATKLVHQRNEVRLIYYYDPSTPEVEGVERSDRFLFTTIPYVKYHRTLFSKIRNITSLAHSADIIYVQTCLPDIALPAIFAGFAARRPVHLDLVGHGDGGQYSEKFLTTMRNGLLKLVDTVSVADAQTRSLVLARGFREFKVFTIAENSFDKDDASEFPLNRAFALLLGDAS
ncbi:MAG: hypothetical protein A2284_02040 [Deltaproteobacteria bacterium RIFOXYA12_FULL_61_11]|nr:MAG: hypothetical protein A2284_02040 [Deltaproteobacteria bacterium RIFOXYA12_FULL_61_11]